MKRGQNLGLDWEKAEARMVSPEQIQWVRILVLC